jgi:hypothetical protein
VDGGLNQLQVRPGAAQLLSCFAPSLTQAVVAVCIIQGRVSQRCRLSSGCVCLVLVADSCLCAEPLFHCCCCCCCCLLRSCLMRWPAI